VSEKSKITDIDHFLNLID